MDNYVLGGLLIVAVGCVAFTNGANANFKGVASLYGSDTTSKRVALWWGTLTTFLGSIVAIGFAQGLIKKFSGRGLVDDGLLHAPLFTTSVAAGTAMTSFIGNRFGFPVSTTHALIGSLVGAGMVGGDEPVRLDALGKQFVYPLFFSPFVAIALGYVSYWVLCKCRVLTWFSRATLNRLHFLSAGAASFARGLNDTPKMAALLLITQSESSHSAILFVAVLITVGGLLDADRVAETLGKKITGMSPTEGFSANAVTALLVTTASFHQMPVSTTHVSVGSMFGLGVSTGQVRWRKLIEILLAWITTLPCGIAFASLALFILRQIFPA